MNTSRAYIYLNSKNTMSDPAVSLSKKLVVLDVSITSVICHDLKNKDIKANIPRIPELRMFFGKCSIWTLHLLQNGLV